MGYLYPVIEFSTVNKHKELCGLTFNRGLVPIENSDLYPFPFGTKRRLMTAVCKDSVEMIESGVIFTSLVCCVHLDNYEQMEIHFSDRDPKELTA